MSLLKSKRNQTIVGLLVIILIAFFVRTYNFSDWLYFKMDQARDALLVSNAVKNGPEHLPLLGPRAGATEVAAGYLRLGPVFYYFQYLGAWLADSTEPFAFAYADLFFSVAVLPLIYLFLRLYFNRPLSLSITFLYSVSFLVIQYSRFAWNPNSLPFFTILSFYGLLRFLSEPEEKKKKWWLILWALGLSIGSQLHFYGFFSLVGISGIMLLLHYKLWKKEQLISIVKGSVMKSIAKYAAIFILVFGIFYTPVIISDVMRKGENAKNFIQAIGSKPKDKTLGLKLQRNLREHVRYYCMISTGSCLKKKLNDFVVPAAFTSGLLLLGIYAGLRKARETKEEIKRNFIILVLTWAIAFWIFTIPVSYQLRPRFFIFVFLVPFIFIGFISEFLKDKFSKYARIGTISLVIIVLGTNLYATGLWFKEQADSQKKNFSIERTLILKNQDGVTLGQLQKAADYIYDNKGENNKVYYYIKPEHVMPLRYLFIEKNDPKFIYSPYKGYTDPEAKYFAVVPADTGLKHTQKKFGDGFEVVEEISAGQIVIYQVKFIRTLDQSNIESFFNQEAQPSDRLFWRDIVGKNEPIEVIDEETTESDEEGDDEENLIEIDAKE